MFCGEPDSQKHRLVHCQAEEVQEVRDKQWGKGQVREWLQEAKEQPLGRDKGWFGRRKPGWRATKEVWYCEPLFVEGETFFLPDLPIYVDGSCFFPTEDEVRAAGAAAVQVKDGVVVRSMFVPLPDWVEHTAGNAEHWAAQLACANAPRPVVIIADCSSVVTTLIKSKIEAMDWKRPHAGFWAEANFEGVQVIKTKAHRSREEAEACGDMEHFIGNEEADTAAKKAAKAGLPTDERVAERFANESFRRTKYLMSVAQILGTWQPTPRLPGEKGKKGGAVERKGRNPHTLVWMRASGRWECQGCGNRFESRTSAHRSSCKGTLNKTIEVAKAAQANGHNVHIALLEGTSGAVVFCTCGLYSQVRTVGLKKACEGKPDGVHPSRVNILEIIGEGQHPDPKIKLGLRQPLPLKFWVNETNRDKIIPEGNEESLRVCRAAGTSAGGGPCSPVTSTQRVFEELHPELPEWDFEVEDPWLPPQGDEWREELPPEEDEFADAQAMCEWFG